MSIILNLKSLIQTTILRHGGWIGEYAADWIVRYGKIKKKRTQEITKENLKITCCKMRKYHKNCLLPAGLNLTILILVYSFKIFTGHLLVFYHIGLQFYHLRSNIKDKYHKKIDRTNSGNFLPLILLRRFFLLFLQLTSLFQ